MPRDERYPYDFEVGGRGAPRGGRDYEDRPWGYEDGPETQGRRFDWRQGGTRGRPGPEARPAWFRAARGDEPVEWARPGPFSPRQRRGAWRGFHTDYARGYRGWREEAPEHAALEGYPDEFRPRRRGYAGEYDRAFPGPDRVRYGHTPTDRWPETGHDLDHPLPGEWDLTDEEIRSAVLENLYEDTWIDPEEIYVAVEDGVVILRGEVSDYLEARYAWDDAWETAGVHGVVNHLTVRADRPDHDPVLPQTAGRPERRRGRPGR